MLTLLAALMIGVPADTVTLTGDIGFVNTSGNTELTTINVGNKLEMSTGGWAVVQKFGVIYGTNEGETSTSLWRAGLRGDRAISERLSLFVLSEFDRNTFAGIGSRYAESVGLAAKLIRGKRDKLDAELGVGYVWQNADDDGLDQEFSVGRAALMYGHALNAKATFSQSIEFLPNLKTSDDLRIHAETSLTAPLSAGIAMKAGYIIRYDGLPEPGFEKSDRILTTGLQVTF